MVNYPIINISVEGGRTDRLKVVGLYERCTQKERRAGSPLHGDLSECCNECDFLKSNTITR
jgi:hypothetical protein